MKSILETSLYLIVMVIITLISIDFITMNISVSKANEKKQYIQHMIEIYGKSEQKHMTIIESILNMAYSQMYLRFISFTLFMELYVWIRLILEEYNENDYKLRRVCIYYSNSYADAYCYYQ